jgi:hypothetical protein
MPLKVNFFFYNLTENFLILLIIIKQLGNADKPGFEMLMKLQQVLLAKGIEEFTPTNISHFFKKEFTTDSLISLGILGTSFSGSNGILKVIFIQYFFRRSTIFGKISTLVSLDFAQTNW